MSSKQASIDVRVANRDDLPQLVPLFDAYRVFYEKPSDGAGAERFLRERLERGESTVLLAYDADGNGVGFVQLYPSFNSVGMARTMILNDLFVAPSAREQGVARALLQRAEETARLCGAVRLELSTAHDNRAAQAVYTVAGWQRDTRFISYTKAL